MKWLLGESDIIYSWVRRHPDYPWMKEQLAFLISAVKAELTRGALPPPPDSIRTTEGEGFTLQHWTRTHNDYDKVKRHLTRKETDTSIKTQTGGSMEWKLHYGNEMAACKSEIHELETHLKALRTELSHLEQLRSKLQA
jgi:hypothetical protein